MLRLPSARGHGPRGVPMKGSRGLPSPAAAIRPRAPLLCIARETPLQLPQGEGYMVLPCVTPKLCATEDDGERARALSFGEPLPGLSGRDFPRHGAAVSADGRQSRGEAASPEAYRGQGRRRALADLG